MMIQTSSAVPTNTSEPMKTKAEILRAAGPEEFVALATHRCLCYAQETRDHHPGRQPENHGSVAHSEGRVLAALAACYGGPVLEIGSDLGISTRYIHDGLDRAEQRGAIYAVDINHKWQDPAPWPRRIQVDADSRLYRCPETPAWAFLDGDHRRRGVLQDIEAAVSSGARRFLFHDTRPGIPKPTNTSDGSEAREVVFEVFGDIEGARLVVWDGPCGLIWAELGNSLGQ